MGGVWCEMVDRDNRVALIKILTFGMLGLMFAYWMIPMVLWRFRSKIGNSQEKYKGGKNKNGNVRKERSLDEIIESDELEKKEQENAKNKAIEDKRKKLEEEQREKQRLEEERLAKEAEEKRLESERLAKIAEENRKEQERLSKEAEEKRAQEERAEEERKAKEKEAKELEEKRIAEEKAREEERKAKEAEKQAIEEQARKAQEEAERIAKEAEEKRLEEERLAKEAEEKEREASEKVIESSNNDVASENYNPIAKLNLDIRYGEADAYLYRHGNSLGIKEREVDIALALFRKYDEDASGEIDLPEFTEIIRSLVGHKMKPLLVKKYATMEFSSSDADKSGAIDKQEFITAFAEIIKTEKT